MVCSAAPWSGLSGPLSFATGLGYLLSMSDLNFHPAVATWFRQRFAQPTEPQKLAWPSIQSGQHTLIAAPTGSGKTLAAFLAALDSLVYQGCAGDLPDETQVVYVSPLKALSNDIRINLQEPLEGIRQALVQHRVAAPLRSYLKHAG